MRESAPSWPVCRSAPSRRQMSTSATIGGKESGLRSRNQGWSLNTAIPPLKVVNLMHTWPLWPHTGATSAESQMVPSTPISPRSPHATYCGDAAAVGQGRLGQALPGERSSLEVSGRPCHSNSGHPLDPLPTLPPFAHIPAAQPCNPLGNPSSPGSMHATHDGGGQAAKKRAKAAKP